MPLSGAGLRGQVAGQTALSTVGQEGAGQLVDLLQAAVNVLLAKLGLGQGAAHFAGSMLGIFGHLLHGVRHFVVCRGSIDNRIRLLLETIDAVAEEIE